MDQEEVDEERLALLAQLRGSFTGFSLTLLGIIQGVALAELAAVVADGYHHFNVVQWLMAVVTLFLFVVMWDHLSRDAMTFSWVPDFRDSAIPFLLGVMELFLCHAVSIGIDVWLLGMVAFAAAALTHLAYVHWRAEQSAENRHVLAYSRQRWRIEWALSLAGIVLFPLLAAGSVAGLFNESARAHGAQSALAICAVILVGLWLAGYVVSTHLSWRATVVRARIDDTLR